VMNAGLLLTWSPCRWRNGF